MKKILLGLWLLSLTVPAVAGSLCATGFSRTGPNVCSNSTTNNLLSTVGSCVDVGASVGSPTARHYKLEISIAANNAVAERDIAIQFFTDAGCTANGSGILTFGIYEMAATVAGTVIHKTEAFPTTALDRRYAKITTNTGGAGTGIVVYQHEYTH